VSRSLSRVPEATETTVKPITDNRCRAYVLQWRDLYRWDLKSARAAAFRAANSRFRRLGDFIEEATELVNPALEPTHEWPVFVVNNKDGVTFSHFQKGETFNAPYKRIRKDWFFHNPTRANVGSLGRVPEVPLDAITSPEYQVWRIKHGLLPEFVQILIRLPFFLDLIECHRVGAVKQRLFVENLCEIPIPVLSDKQQCAIVDRWGAAESEIASANERVEKRKVTIDACFLADLGLKSPKQIPMPKAFTVLWKDFGRWGVGFNYLRQSVVDLAQGKYPVVELRSILELVQYGTSEKANTNADGVAVIRMNNIVDGEFDLTSLKHLRLSQAEMDRLLLEEGDILFNRTNSKELVGKCAVFHASGDFVFASYLIRVRADPAKTDAHFLACVINSPIGRQQINALSRQIIGQANINTEELRSLQIPLPPLSFQKQIRSRGNDTRAGTRRTPRQGDTRRNRGADSRRQNLEITNWGKKKGHA
jgi:type I restriction enzyme, S subunit